MITGFCLGISLLLIACQGKTPDVIPSVTEPAQSQSQTAESVPSDNGTKPLTPTKEEIQALMDKLAPEISGEIVQFLCLDFDNDKTFEAFAIVGSKDETIQDTYTGELWFVSDKAGSKIGEASSYSYLERISIGNGYLMTVDKNYGGLSYSHLYGVKDGQPYEDDISGRLIGLKQEANGTITAVQDTYDACTDGTGHTWKPYWFCWEDGLREYGALEITEQEFLKYDGSEAALKRIDDQKGQLVSILRRENGIININYQTPWTRDGVDDYINNMYLNLMEKDGALTILETDDNRGVYLPALMPEIAVFPK